MASISGIQGGPPASYQAPPARVQPEGAETRAQERQEPPRPEQERAVSQAPPSPTLGTQFNAMA